ncbi:cation diffusion facilitator family transporter [Inquilinus limosus]|uniref:cation diffusion facilitator family transporter n=1 Tax=Inquilinus limosus TaxID=171674 RepID=UPI0009DC0615|nr:cation diffusion facilitator family transporter [Inquilinus limosus]
MQHDHPPGEAPHTHGSAAGRGHAAHGHGPGHDHHPGHHHGMPEGADGERRLLAALAITAGFMLLEAAGGWIANSLALLADAGHMLTDAAALALAWLAARMARRPRDARRSYGYGRVQVLAAFANGIVLLAVVVAIVVEAAGRLAAPAPVEGGLMMGIAAAGLVANLVAYRVLQGGDRTNLNLRGAALHVMGDLLGSIGALAAGAVILLTGWTPIDPILSVLVSLLVLRSAWAILRESGHVLVEGTPGGIDEAALTAAILAGVPAVIDVHHVHAWTLTPGRPIVTLHARLREGADSDQAIGAVTRLLRDRFGIDHATVQAEFEICADVAHAPRH